MMTLEWQNSVQRFVEKAVEAGYDRDALVAATEDIAKNKGGRDWIHIDDVHAATVRVRNRKGNKHLPTLDQWGDRRNPPPTPPPGGFVYTLFEWGTGRVNPKTHMWEHGRMVDGEWVEGKVPIMNKNGTPITRDVIGRFLAKMSGGSGNFTTDGYRLWSYGWELARWDHRDGVPVVCFRDRMWDQPYGPTTGDHMADAYEHLKDRAVNAKTFPDRKMESLAQSLSHAARTGLSMEEMRKGLTYNYRFTPPWKKIFAIARTTLRQTLKQDRLSADNFLAGSAKDIYTKESIIAYRAWAHQRGEAFFKLLAAYEERITNTNYGKKFPPVPNRFGKQPQLVKKDSVRTEEQAILGWWFSNDLVLGYGDGRSVAVGVTHEAGGNNRGKRIEACEFGLHASPSIAQAYDYVSGRYLCRVLQWGVMDYQNDKQASQFRQYLAIFDTRTYGAPDEMYGMDLFARDMREDRRSEETEKFERKILERMGMTIDQRTPVAVPEPAQEETVGQ